MSTEVLIGIQLLVIMLLGIGMLVFLVRRQRKTINQLQRILTEVKDEISGEGLVRHLQLEIDNTTAHCKQDTIALRPDLEPEDMALSLRFLALQAELALIQDTIGGKAPWREQIKRYEELAHTLQELTKSRIEQAARILKDAHSDELAARDTALADLDAKLTRANSQLKSLKPLQDFVANTSGVDMTPAEVEQKLHRALLDLCENFPNTEKTRELVYLLHEAFNDMGARNDATMMHYDASGEPEHSAVGIDPTQNIEILNNIINNQNETIRDLRKQIDALADEHGRVDMQHTIDTLQQNVDSTSDALHQLENGIEFSPPVLSGDAEEMYKIITKFTEESAQMVERIHLLSNENKQLMLENEKMRIALEGNSEQEEPMVAGLKLKIEKQTEEIISLQKNLKELEENFLALYEEKSTS